MLAPFPAVQGDADSLSGAGYPKQVNPCTILLHSCTRLLSLLFCFALHLSCKMLHAAELQ